MIHFNPQNFAVGEAVFEENEFDFLMQYLGILWEPQTIRKIIECSNIEVREGKKYVVVSAYGETLQHALDSLFYIFLRDKKDNKEAREDVIRFSLATREQGFGFVNS